MNAVSAKQAMFAFDITKENLMDDEIREIAARIKELREVCGYSREDLAKELKIEYDTYVSYEESGLDIPIGVLYQISKKFGVDLSEILTGKAARLTTYHVVRGGDGQVIDRFPGYYFKDLAFRFTNKIMQPLLVTIDPSDKPAELVTHNGEEFNYIIEGTIILTIGDKEISLNAGDSCYFNPQLPHGQKCGGDKPATFLTMITE